MLSSLTAEEIFLVFYDLVDIGKISVQHQDWSPIQSFYTKIQSNDQLTKNQANYIEKLLEKYKNVSATVGFDYRQSLPNLKWKQQFRILDLSKKIYVEKRSDGKIEICLKFPYQLKKEFDEEINVNISNSGKISHWDQEEKVRRLNLYEFNLLSIYDFVKKHNFEIDETFMSVLADVEEIWQNHEDLIPRSHVIDEQIQLINAIPNSLEYFEKHRSGNLMSDAFLAKSMGYPIVSTSNNVLDRIVSSSENSFWIKENNTFFEIYKEINGKACIVLDRTLDVLSWLKKFVADANSNGILREDIKVCFRESKESKLGINEWIKLARVGGSVESGRILIFESKPAKWLFKNSEDVKILVTNNIYPPTNNLTKDWVSGHPCVIYLSETKPTEHRGRKIVEL